MKIKVEPLRHEGFEDFGIILGKPEGIAPNISDDISEVWLGMSDLMGIGRNRSKDITFLRIHSKPQKNDKIEKHDTTAEAFIPLKGKSILMMVPAKYTLKNNEPDMKKVRAFLMEGDKGVLLKPGTWHTVPVPISDSADYLVLVDESIVEKDDLNIRTIDPIEFYYSDCYTD